MTRICIFGGNINQAKRWAEHHLINPKDRRIVYIHSPCQMEGMINMIFIKIGTWYDHENADKIIAVAKTRILALGLK